MAKPAPLASAKSWHEAFDEQGRWPLRRWVERVWLKLGGPPVWITTARYKMPRPISISWKPAIRRGPADFERFENRVADLFAQPENPAGAGLQVMTIHKAKGLEFDTVILPGLGRHSKLEDKPLILFHEWREGGQFRMPDGAHRRNPRRTRRPLPVFTRHRQAERQMGARTPTLRRRHARQETASSHGARPLDRTGEPEPASDSMLRDLWPALSS